MATFTVTSTVTNNTAYNGTVGAISVTSISGGTSPYTYYWSDLITPSGTSYTSGTITRSALYSGEYILNVTDNVGAVYSETFTVKGITTSDTQLHLGTLESGNLGACVFMRAIDTTGRICVTFPNSASTTLLAKLADVVVFTKTGATWTKYAQALTLPGGDTTNYVMGISTNGFMIAILMNSVSDITSQNTSTVKKVYIYTVSGSSITYSTTIPVYQNGTSTYVYGMTGYISFRENTICVPVRMTSSDGIYGYVYKLSSGTWSYHSNIFLTASTTSTNIITIRAVVGSDLYIYLSCLDIVSGSFAYAGGMTMAFFNGSTWTTNSISGTATNQSLGKSMSAHKDSFLVGIDSTTSAKLYTYTNGVLSAPVSITMYSNNGADSLLVYENTIMYPTSATSYTLSTRKSSSSDWTSLTTTTSIPLTNTGSGIYAVFNSSFTTNGIDIIYADPTFSNNLGQLMWTKTNTNAPTITKSAGTISSTSIGVPTISGGITKYYYSWADSGSITTNTRTGLSPGSYTLTIKDVFDNSTSQAYTIGSSLSVLSYASISPTITTIGGTCTIPTGTAFSGGTPPYTYRWSDQGSDIQTIVSRTSMSAGTYTLTATDSAGSTGVATYVLNNPSSQTECISGGIASASPVGTTYVKTLTGYGQIEMITHFSTPIFTQNGITYNIVGGASGTTSTAYYHNGSTWVQYATGSNATSLSLTSITSPSILIYGYKIFTTATGNCALTITRTTDATSTNGNLNNAYTAWAGAVTTQLNGQHGSVEYTSSPILYFPTTLVASFSGVSLNAPYGIMLNILNSSGSVAITRNYATNTTTDTTMTNFNLNGFYFRFSTSGGSNQGGSVNLGTLAFTKPTITIITTSVVLTANSISGFTVSGDVTYAYSWSDGYLSNSTTGISNRTGLTPNTVYTLTVLGLRGGTASTAFTTSNYVTITPGLFSNETSPGTNDGSIGAATIINNAATPPYTYSWNDIGSSATTTRSGLAAGTYTLTVTDSAAHTVSYTYTITRRLALNVAGTTTNPTVTSGATGSIGVGTYLYGSSPFTYVWSDVPGSTLTTLVARTGLSAGTYTLTASDASTNTVVTAYTIVDPFSQQNIVSALPDSSTSDLFGQSVAIYGSYCIIGSPNGDFYTG